MGTSVSRSFNFLFLHLIQSFNTSIPIKEHLEKINKTLIENFKNWKFKILHREQMRGMISREEFYQRFFVTVYYDTFHF